MSPRPRHSRLSHALVLKELGARPSSDRRREVIERVARALVANSQPRKSLATTQRHARAASVPADVLDDLAARTLELLARKQEDAATAVTVASPFLGEWCAPREAAEHLRVPLGWISERLATEEGRRSLAWPWFDGARWRIPRAAVDANTRAAFLATLPSEEPLAHRATLPVYLRQVVCEQALQGGTAP